MAQLKLFGSARGGARVAKRGKKEKPARQKKPLKALAIVLTVLLCLEGLYFLCIYSNIPFIVKYRTIYINTAMNTMRHQWLATYFIPAEIIDQVRYEYGLEIAKSVGTESPPAFSLRLLCLTPLIPAIIWQIPPTSVRNSAAQ